MKEFVWNLAVFFASIFFLIFACNKAKAPKCDGTASTYNSNMQTLINAKCSSPACHPTYTTYVGIKSTLDLGTFKDRVITKKDMPSGSSLTSSELNKIQCWIDAGYPQN